MLRKESWIEPASILAAAAVVWAVLFAMISGFRDHPSGMKSLNISIMVISLAAGTRLLFHVWKLWKAGVSSPLARIREDFIPAVIEFMPIPIGVGLLGVFLVSVNYLKSMISAVIPFWADAPLAASDAALRISPAGLGAAFQPIIVQLGIFYGFWHAVQLGGILWVLHWRAGEEKSRLIIAFMLTWAIGMALAYAFSSAGPIFTGRYDPALAPESMRRVVHFLWTNYEAGTATLGAGISAFPSMHVAIAAWFALVLREKKLWLLGLAYASAIFVCSIILGWHYFLDGVAGVAIALAANRLSKAWLLRRQSTDNPASRLASAPI